MHKLPSPCEFELLSLALMERSGREIAGLYRSATGKPIAYGTLYTTLRRMKERGWVSSRESADADGRLRFFRITGKGTRAREQFTERTNAWYALGEQQVHPEATR
jgi:DNA-binding PadR family transcriptional regulator